MGLSVLAPGSERRQRHEGRNRKGGPTGLDTSMKSAWQALSTDGVLGAAAPLLAALSLLASPPPAGGQTSLTLANPHWNITLTDAGYSDFLLDNTPGFEGREYLCGEWGAAVGFRFVNGAAVPPQWLERNFVFPDWVNGSTFHVATPLAQTGLNADGLPVAQSVITNAHLEVTLRHEMLDTVVGTPMGTTPASAANTGAFLDSDRYVLKQTATIRNTSELAITNLQFFQFLHGLSSQRGVYDDRRYGGSLSNFQHDVTLAGVDAWAVGAGSSPSGLEDYISFHATQAPSAWEIGHYGIEGNGVDAHSIGKPSDGVHLSIENNWQTPPYSTRQGTDDFAPARRWVAGAQRWDLGAVGPGQSASLDIILSLRTGTKVRTGTGSSGGCNGGSGVPGGMDYEFEDVTAGGSCFAEFTKADDSELALRIDEGKLVSLTFPTPGGPTQVWRVQFTGAFSGNVRLTFGYDPTTLPAGFDETALCLYQLSGGVWQALAGVVDPVQHTIHVTTAQLSAFALGADGASMVTVSASISPANSGTITGDGAHAQGASVSLVAAAEPGYVFSNWTESGSVASLSPAYTFLAQADRTLVANFASVGSAKSVTTSSLPSNGGSTSGDGAYALGSSATVIAVPSAGYKFSKWLDNGAIVGTSRTNTFTVTGDHALVAKFKPVYSVTVTAEPQEGGSVEADPFYEVNELAKLKAQPNPGYSFVNWTQNGMPVSTVTNFRFNVSANRELVGHFALGNRVDVSSEPVNGGTVSGGGIHGAGALVTVRACALPGYVFREWTEGGGPVSASPAYSFTSTVSRVLVANYVAQPGIGALQTQPDTMVLSWPAGANGWELLECTNLVLGHWTASPRAVEVVGGQKQVTITPSASGFFRLVLP
jgi:hypothetical protein